MRQWTSGDTRIIFGLDMDRNHLSRKSRTALLRAHRRIRELIAPPEQLRLARETVRRVFQACYRPSAALPHAERRQLLARGIAIAGAATVPAMAISSEARAALVSLTAAPAMLYSDVAGRYPGDGTHRPLGSHERFFNLADGKSP